jgi:hypothetical protein
LQEERLSDKGQLSQDEKELVVMCAKELLTSMSEKKEISFRPNGHVAMIKAYFGTWIDVATGLEVPWDRSVRPFMIGKDYLF